MAAILHFPNLVCLQNCLHVPTAKYAIGSKKRSYCHLASLLEGIVESSLNICVTYDSSRFGPFVIGRSGIPETGAYSVCCAIQNLWLAARVEDIGVGWVSILSNDVVRSALDIPDHILPIAYLCVGHVNNFADKPDLENVKWLPRINLDDVTYNEKWGRA